VFFSTGFGAGLHCGHCCQTDILILHSQEYVLLSSHALARNGAKMLDLLHVRTFALSLPLLGRDALP
jgi:hypothetical protein